MRIIKNYNDEVKGSIEGIKLYHKLVKAALRVKAPIVHYIDRKTPEFVIVDEDSFICEAFKSEAGYYIIKSGTNIVTDGQGHNMIYYENDTTSMVSNGIIIFNDMKYIPEVQEYIRKCGFINTERLESEIEALNNKYNPKIEALKDKGLSEGNLIELRAKYQKDYDIEILNAFEQFT